MNTIRTKARKLAIASILAAALMLVNGCALVGAGLGAATGAALDPMHPGRGAVVGATLGAITGSIFDAHHYRYSFHTGYCCDGPCDW